MREELNILNDFPPPPHKEWLDAVDNCFVKSHVEYWWLFTA